MCEGQPFQIDSKGWRWSRQFCGADCVCRRCGGYRSNAVIVPSKRLNGCFDGIPEWSESTLAKLSLRNGNVGLGCGDVARQPPSGMCRVGKQRYQLTSFPRLRGIPRNQLVSL